MRRNPRLGLLLLGWALCSGVLAAPATTSATIEAPAELPSRPPAVLAPLAAAWPELDAETRQRLQAQAEHWQALTPEQQLALRQRMAEWDQLPATERARQRAAFAAWQRLDSDARQQLQQAATRLATLPAAQQQALRAAFQALPPDQRQDWWLGPSIGAGFAELRPLFAYVPENERAGLIALLGELSEKARAELALLARRLPAQAREKLRHDLLALPADQRERWIGEQVRPAAP